MRSYTNSQINKEERERAKMAKWLTYGRCEDCRAATGQPCRDRLGPSVVVLDRPHPYRPLL